LISIEFDPRKQDQQNIPFYQKCVVISVDNGNFGNFISFFQEEKRGEMAKFEVQRLLIQ
jgi:hypothetical protein